MQVEKHPLTIVLQTVRLPQGRNQFVVPSGCPINRGQLLAELNRTLVDASHHVIQPETGREGVERLAVLGTQQLPKTLELNLREWLQGRLKSVPEVINEVSQHSTNGDLPASSVLAHWQDEMRTRFDASAIGRANSPSRGSNYRSLFVVLGFGLLAITLWMVVPRISYLLSINGSAKNDAGNDDIPKLISKQWNLTNNTGFEGEVDLLKLLDPLVSPTPRKLNRDRLIHVLKSVNQVRLDNSANTNEGKPESDDKVLRSLLSDGALNSYVRKLVSTDGRLNRFGQVANNIDLVALQQLLPTTVDQNTVSTYHRLTRQLLGVAPIGPQGETLLEEKMPFFDFAEQSEKVFEHMVRTVPKSLSDAPSDRTFFIEDDCIAAREITAYFKSFSYLNERGLGFTSDAKRHERLEKYSSRFFASILNDWKAFTDGKLNNPQPIQ